MRPAGADGLVTTAAGPACTLGVSAFHVGGCGVAGRAGTGRVGGVAGLWKEHRPCSSARRLCCSRRQGLADADPMTHAPGACVLMSIVRPFPRVEGGGVRLRMQGLPMAPAVGPWQQAVCKGLQHVGWGMWRAARQHPERVYGDVVQDGPRALCESRCDTWFGCWQDGG